LPQSSRLSQGSYIINGQKMTTQANSGWTLYLRSHPSSKGKRVQKYGCAGHCPSSVL